MAHGQSGARMRRIRAFSDRLRRESADDANTSDTARLWEALRRLVVALAGGVA
jgi:hypothetical protein